MRQQARLLAAVALVVAGGAIAFAGAAPEGYKSVSDVTGDPERHLGAAVEVKAAVKPGSLNESATPATFLITDGRNDLLVTWEKPVPDHEVGGALEGRTVVVKGVLARGSDGGLVLQGSDMQVGCASKYAPQGESAPA